jgi:hypothetical protein
VVVMEVFHGAILVAGVMLVVPLLPLNPLLLSVMATGVIGPRPSILEGSEGEEMEVEWQIIEGRPSRTTGAWRLSRASLATLRRQSP